MFLAELKIENFRVFGEGEKALVLPLRRGLTALVGENDAGKTAIVDALRLALGTRDQESYRIDEYDFHQPHGAAQSAEIRIRCKFDGLTLTDKGAFAEYLTYEGSDAAKVAVVYVNWKAVANARAGTTRRFTSVEVRSGKSADGPQLDQAARMLLCATYLRPMRDAERAMSAGRGSRLSQILQHTKEVKESGVAFDPETGPPDDLARLSVLGIGDFANDLLEKHAGLRTARRRLNDDYLQNLSFAGKPLEGHISVSAGDDDVRRRQLLEKLELELRDTPALDGPPNRGLGSNNLLFMACELLLLGAEQDGFPFLVIEEPEAHLHPQRQLRLMQFLQQQVNLKRGDDQSIQVLITTHSPHLASAIKLDNLVLLQGGKAFPLAFGDTCLDRNDYGFLERFLDATKANLFFARGVLIVEGDAENLLFPTIARLIGRDLTENGVSIVNVGTTGLGRYARIYQRKRPDADGVVGTPVACVADLDIMPDCAPELVGKIEQGQNWPERNRRRWRVRSDFPGESIGQERARIRARAAGQNVETFVADQWTLEYDLIAYGLACEVWLAVRLARADEQISSDRTSVFRVARQALRDWAEFIEEQQTEEQKASRIYAPLADGSVSKPITAQYLAAILGRREMTRSTQQWREIFPPYIVSAIDYVTVPKLAQRQDVRAAA